MNSTFMYVYTFVNLFIQSTASSYFIYQANANTRFRSITFSILTFPIVMSIYRTIFNMIPGIPVWGSFIIGYFSLLLATYCSFRFNSIFKLLKEVLVLYICMFASELIAVGISSFILQTSVHIENNYNDYNIMYVIGTPLSGICLFIIFETILLLRMIRNKHSRKLYLILTSVTVYQLILLGAFYWSISKFHYVEAVLGMLIFCLTLIVDYLILKYVRSIIRNDDATNELSRLEELYRQEYAIIQENEVYINSLRSRRHDYINQLDVINGMIASKASKEDIESFIDQIIDSNGGVTDEN